MLSYVEMCSSEMNYDNFFMLANVRVHRWTDNDLCFDLFFVEFHSSCIMEIGVRNSVQGQVTSSEEGICYESGFKEEPSMSGCICSITLMSKFGTIFIGVYELMHCILSAL